MEHVLYEVFSYLAINELYTTACVCKLWFHSSIPLLYKDVDISEALAPLGQLVLGSNHYFQFEEPITDLARFRRYAHYVQILAIDERHVHVAQTLAKWLNQEQPEDSYVYPFPRLRSLRCGTKANRGGWDISCLLPPNLDHFYVKAPYLTLDYFKTIHQSLTKNCADLYCLIIDFPENRDAKIASQCIPLFEELLEKFKKTLICVEIPTIFMTASVAAHLADIRNLCVLSVGMSDTSATNAKLDTRRFAAVDGKGNFSTLRQFSYYGSAAFLYDTFLLPHDLTSVTTFAWDFGLDPKLDISSLFSALHRLFPRLTGFFLGGSEMYMHGIVEIDEIPLLEWSSVRTILACRDLTALSLHGIRVKMTTWEIFALLKDRPTWKQLQIYTDEPFGLHNLAGFPEYCPNLKRLGLHFNTVFLKRIERNPRSFDPSWRPMFEHLCSIDFAYSMIPMNLETTVSRYLYEHCVIPPRIYGWDRERWDRVEQWIARYYIEEEEETGEPMSPEAQAYLETVRRKILMKMDSKSGGNPEGDDEDVVGDDDMGTND